MHFIPATRRECFFKNFKMTFSTQKNILIREYRITEKFYNLNKPDLSKKCENWLPYHYNDYCYNILN